MPALAALCLAIASALGGCSNTIVATEPLQVGPNVPRSLLVRPAAPTCIPAGMTDLAVAQLEAATVCYMGAEARVRARYIALQRAVEARETAVAKALAAAKAKP